MKITTGRNEEPKEVNFIKIHTSEHKCFTIELNEFDDQEIKVRKIDFEGSDTIQITPNVSNQITIK